MPQQIYISTAANFHHWYH